MVSFRAKSCPIYLITSIYSWLDFSFTMYEYDNCFFLIQDPELVINEIIYKVTAFSPLIFISSFVSMTLTYRGVYMLNKLIRGDKSKILVGFQIDDDTEIIYTHSDILYVYELFQNSINKPSNKKLMAFTRFFRMITNLKIKQKKQVFTTNQQNKSRFDQFKGKIRFLIKTISNYDWQNTFSFSSRFTNMHIVAILTFYHLSVMFLNYISLLLILDFDEKIYNGARRVINLSLKEFTLSAKLVLFIPFLISFFVCIIQFLLAIRDTKKHLIEIYKGKCKNIPSFQRLSTPSIASSSFLYGGYLTGYLAYGFLIQYFALFVFGLFITFLRIIFGDANILELAKRISIPVLVVIGFHKTVAFIGSRMLFMKRGVLAINNFRAFNLFLHFKFFFDCFTGVLSAVWRIFFALIASIFMMPRIGYSFMGRNLENLDSGTLRLLVKIF